MKNFFVKNDGSADFLYFSGKWSKLAGYKGWIRTGLYYGVVDGNYIEINYPPIEIPVVAPNKALAILNSKEMFERGEVVLIRKDTEDDWEERIYLTTIEGARSPYIVVLYGDKEKFLDGKEFCISCFGRIKKKPQKVQLTVAEVAKRLGYDVDEIEIV